MTNTSKRRPRGSVQLRKEKRAAAELWGYDVWIRQEAGTRKRYREFTFATKAEASTALAALKTAGWKARYGLKSPSAAHVTSVKEAIASYVKLSLANLQANRTDDSTYWRTMPGHLRTLQRWADFVGINRPVNSIQRDDFVFWVAAETERGKTSGKAIKKSTIRRGLNTIRAALNHAVQTSADLKGYRVPRSPLTKKCEDERDRVLSDEQISKISTALCSRPDWADVLFFFRLGLIPGARMAEVRRMRWDESSERFGTVKLYSSKTKKWRTLRAPSAASLIAERKVANHQDAILVLPCSDHRIRKILKKVSESVDIRYGQNVLDGWCPHDLRHTCLTNLAVAGVPLNGIKEYAGHASIVETQRYLKFMPESIELAAKQSTRLAQLTGVRFDSQVRTRKQSK